jgi:hypothetical protein
MKSTTGWSWVGRRETLEAFHSSSSLEPCAVHLGRRSEMTLCTYLPKPGTDRHQTASPPHRPRTQPILCFTPTSCESFFPRSPCLSHSASCFLPSPSLSRTPPCGMRFEAMLRASRRLVRTLSVSAYVHARYLTYTATGARVPLARPRRRRGNTARACWASSPARARSARSPCTRACAVAPPTAAACMR